MIHMTRLLFILILVILSSCSNIDRAIRKNVRPIPVNGVCAKEGIFFDIGRFKFTIKLNSDWRYSEKPWDQGVSFHYLKDGVASGINVRSYHNNVNWLANSWHDPELIFKKKLQFYNDYTSKKPRYNPFHDLRIVKKAGLECVRSEEAWEAPSHFRNNNPDYKTGIEHNLSFACVVPGQLDRRPIRIGIAQSTGARATPLDLEAILAPVFESLVLNPTPPPLPKDY
ncbi:MAG: hypothetical protein WBB19_10300 [Desulforhopalus sp.]